MIRTSELHRRAVVDIDGAERLGYIDKIIVDPDARRVAGFLLSRGSLLGGGPHTIVPAASVRAIGPDAVTVHRRLIDAGDAAAVDQLPRLSDLVRRKVVSQTGRLLGYIGDVLIDESDGRILGYALTAPGSGGRWDEMFGAADRSNEPSRFLRANAELRAGKDLVVVPDDAVVDQLDFDDPAPLSPTGQPIEPSTTNPPPPASGWTRYKPAPVRQTEWVQQDHEAGT